MPGFLVTTASSVQCPHAARATISSSNVRVKANGTPVALQTDVTTVAACPFQVPIGTGTKPQPCVTVRWLVPATRVRVGGTPVLLQSSSGLCQSAEQIPQGPPAIVQTQTRVKGV